MHFEGGQRRVFLQGMVYEVLEGLLINKILRDVNDLDEPIIPERGT